MIQVCVSDAYFGNFGAVVKNCLIMYCYRIGNKNLIIYLKKNLPLKKGST